MKKMKFGLLSLLSLALFSCTPTEIVPDPVPVPVAVTGVSLNKPTTSILEGATETLTAVVAPAEAANKAVAWSTSDAAIATVSEAGLVTAVKEGTATITVTSVADKTKTATCVVTVSKTVVAVEGVSLNKATTSIVEGATETLSAVVAPATATNQNLTWSTSDAAILAVSNAGVVTAIKEGKAAITVTTKDGNKTATCAVTVSKTVVAVTGVSLNKPTTSMLESATETLSAVVAPATATNQNLTWTTSNAAIATVSEAGLVTAVKEGTATITVTTKDGNKTAICVVTVSKTVVPVTGVSLNKATASIVEGATEPLSAVVVPATATNQNLTWTSSDATIATVSNAGVVTALKEGKATITVTTADGNKTATCTVTAIPAVVINTLAWAKGNLVADGANGCKVGKATDIGLYFHFGSLVGWAGGATGDGTGTGSPALAAWVKPVGYLGSTTWPAGYYTGGTTDDKGYNYPATDAAATGIGDPCRYYLGAPWRTPTAAEYLMLLGVAGDKTNKSVPLKVNGSALVFPGSGVRASSDGSLGNVGLYGYCWSSSIYDATVGGYSLNFGSSGGVNPQGGLNRSNGFSVRCVAPVS